MDTCDKPLALLYTPLFLIRRLIFALTVILADNILVQLYVTMYTSLVLVLFYAVVWPMDGVVNNILQLGNEVFFLTCVHIMLAFSDYTPDPVKSHQIGVFYLIFLAVNVAANIGLIAYSIVKQSQTEYRKWKAAKEQKENAASRWIE